MSHKTVKLNLFLSHRPSFSLIDDNALYKRVRVQLHGKGLVIRDQVPGDEIKTKKQQTIREGQFLVAEIDAKVGGFGIVPKELNGAIVSSHYFLFDIDEKQCLRQWLEAYIQLGALEEQVKAQGSTNYAAIRPEHVLGYTIPLPTVSEQLRLLDRFSTIEKLRALHSGVGIELDALRYSILDRTFNGGL